MAELFQKIEDRKDDLICEVSLSFLEIYNEEIRDLLAEPGSFAPRGGLAMREDKTSRITVANLIEKRPANADEVKAMVLEGNARRTQSPTLANQTSSRSHAVLQVNVTQTPRTAGTTEERTMATLSIIDLAGSERASATTNMGQRMVEGANINKSLLALGNCINALCESGGRTRHVPYRNSKLTRLLKFSLGGNCKTVMIVCVAPASNHYDDTQNTLKYANRAKDIKTKVTRNFLNVDRHVGQYVEAINRLNDEVTELKAKLAGKLGAEADIQRRRKEEAKNELARVKSDLQAKSDQTRPALVEGATSEASIFAARTRLQGIRPRLDQLILDAANGPLSSDLAAERNLLESLASADERLVRSESSARMIVQRANNSNAMFEATLRAVSERRSDRLDEFCIDNVRIDAKHKKADMDRVKAEARESVLKAALECQATMTAQLVGLLARCTVMMSDGGSMLSKSLAGATVDPTLDSVVRDVAASMTRVAQSNDSAFSTLLGQTTASFQSAQESTLLRFSSHPTSTASSSSQNPLPTAGKPKRLSLAPARSRPSLAPTSQQSSPRRPHKSPRKSVGLRHAYAPPAPRHPPPRRQVEKKSVRWRDETSQGEIDDKGLQPVAADIFTACPSTTVPKVTVQVSLPGKKPSAGSESENEWEDEKTDDSVNISFLSASGSANKVLEQRITLPGKRSRPNRLDPNYLRSARPSPMGSLGEVEEDEERQQPSTSSRGSPLSDMLNKQNPYSHLSASPSKLRPNQPQYRPSTPPRTAPTYGSPARRPPTVPGSTSKNRRRSNIGPVRVERTRRRSSLIPRPSPPGAGGSSHGPPPRKSPSKRPRRISMTGQRAPPLSYRQPISSILSQSTSSYPSFDPNMSVDSVGGSGLRGGGGKPTWR